MKLSEMSQEQLFMECVNLRKRVKSQKKELALLNRSNMTNCKLWHAASSDKQDVWQRYHRLMEEFRLYKVSYHDEELIGEIRQFCYRYQSLNSMILEKFEKLKEETKPNSPQQELKGSWFTFKKAQK